MKKYMITIIILSLIIVGLLFILFIGKNKYDDKIKESNEKIVEFKKKIKDLKKKEYPQGNEFEKLPEKEKVIVYKEVIKDNETLVRIAEDCTKQLEKTTKDLDQCNTKLKRKDKLLINLITGIGFDQEFNINAMAGGTVNAKIYDGLFSRIYIGGGGVYTVRTDFNHQISGGDLIFNVIITLGK